MTQEFMVGWKKAKEQTMAESNNVSPRQCKALAQDTYLATLEASLMSMVPRSGMAFESCNEVLTQSYPK
jgi:hypothetical protein